MKKILLILTFTLLTLCSCQRKDDMNKKNIELKEKNEEIILKEGQIDNLLKISVLNAKKINKNKVGKYIDKDDFNKDSTYIYLEYRIEDLRGNNLKNMPKSSIKTKIRCKDKKAKVIRSSEKFSKSQNLVKNLVDVSGDIKKIDLKFELSKLIDGKNKNLNLSVIL